MKIVEPKYEILTDISEGALRSSSRSSEWPGSATRAKTRSRRMVSRQRNWWAFW